MSTLARPLGARERELLLTCSRLDGGDERLQGLAELMRADLDWEASCLHALLHSVAPLVHLRLRGLPEYGQVPAAARRRLLGLSHRAGYQNRHFAAEHRELVGALGDEGIEVMVPKGISLVDLVYGAPERRPLIDLVYIVRPGTLAATARALERRGYEPRPGHPAHAAWRWLCPSATMMIERGVSIIVIVLTAAVSRPRVHSFELAEVWSRAERVCVAGAEALMPSPEDLVIYLCAQADAHGYLNGAAAPALDPDDLLFAGWTNNRLVRFVDIRETVRHHEGRIDWERLAERAEGSGLGAVVRVGLELTEALLGPTVPDGVLDRLPAEHRHGPRGWLFEAVRSQADRDGLGTAPADGTGGNQWAVASAVKRRAGSWWLRLGPRRQSRLAPLLFLAEYAFCDLDELRRRHPRCPGSALALAYPLRAAWVLARSAAGVVARLSATAVGRARSVAAQRPGEAAP